MHSVKDSNSEVYKIFSEISFAIRRTDRKQDRAQTRLIYS